MKRTVGGEHLGLRALKRLGEEASTKLVFPMILLLGSVMIMLLVPAFLGTGI